jgi:hypothetical protein
MNGCKGCKWWSELIAQWTNGRGMEAWCFNKSSPSYQSYAHEGCELKELGIAIDDPSQREVTP